MRFKVKVARIDEVVHKSADDDCVATSIQIDEDGAIKITRESGDKYFGAGAWSSVSIERTPPGH